MSQIHNKKMMHLIWEELPFDRTDRPTLRNSHCLATDPSRKLAFIFGGRSKGGSNNHLYVLSLEDRHKGWRLIDAKGDVPMERKSAGLVYVEDNLYLFGGNDNRRCLQDMYRYNILTRTWTRVEIGGDSAPCARDRHSLTAYDDRHLLLFGGHSEEEEFLNDLWTFDVRTSVWTELRPKGDAPKPRYEHSVAAIGHSLVVLGGKCRDGGIADVMQYDVRSNSWRLPPIHDIKREPCWGQCAVSFHNKVVVFGGWNGKSCFNEVAVLDTSNNPWQWLQFQVLGDRPSIRTFHAAGILGPFMVVVGGRNMSKRLNDTYMLDISDLGPNALKDVIPIKPDLDTKDKIPEPKKCSKLHLESKKKKISLKDFKLKTTLGTGSFGRVRLVEYLPTDEIFAMKMLRKSRVVEMKQENHIKWEKKILSSIRHPFIVNMEASFQDKIYLFLVLELVPGGEFFTLLRKTGTLRFPHAVFYGAQIVLVFQFLHKNKIVYRDLKPENLLIGQDGYLRLTDFGFAKRLEEPCCTWTLCGTPEYIAPEILLNRGHSFSVDWWALGILLFEMFTGNPPFVDDNPMKIYQKILDGRINYPSSMKQRAKDFISKLLTKNLARRIGSQQDGAQHVMRHMFFEGVDWERILWKKVTPPYIPPRDLKSNFDPYDEDTDTEDMPLDVDPFERDF